MTLNSRACANAPVRPKRRASAEHASECETNTPRESRSANNFASPAALLQALVSSNLEGSYHTPVQAGCAFSSGLQKKLEELEGAISCTNLPKVKDVDQKLDWVLENYDAGTTRQQSLEDELRRLLVLKSFLVLDTERKEAFDRITLQAKERFDCPMAVISLVDLGRQWFLSSQGLGDATETPRKLAFCAHTIQSKEDCLVVPDATKDPRFLDNPFVTGEADVRFYAGAPLITQDGYRLGTLCVIDKVIRPRGISSEDRDYLKELASIVVRTMESHRNVQSVWFKNLKQTHFPSLEDLAEIESDNGGANAFECEIEPEEPSMETTQDEELMKLLEMAEELGSNKCSVAVNPANERSNLLSPSKQSKSRHVRFEVDPEEPEWVKEDLYEVECWKGIKKNIWWSSNEMYTFRLNADRTARSYRKKEPGYAQSLEMVVTEDEGAAVQELMRELTEKYTTARGLELQVSRLLSKKRRKLVKAVLREQSQCYHDDAESMAWHLREESMTYSLLAKRFAERIGKCDQIHSLRSNLNRWEPSSGDGRAPLARSNSMPIRRVPSNEVLLQDTDEGDPAGAFMPSISRWGNGASSCSGTTRSSALQSRWGSADAGGRPLPSRALSLPRRMNGKETISNAAA